MKNLTSAATKKKRSAHRRTDRKPSEITLNSGEGLRAAYYVEDDPASYSSLKQHIHQIDLLFPEWVHVVSADGALTSYTIDNRPFAVVDGGGVHSVDHENKVAHAIAENQDQTPAEIFPLVNNYDPVQGLFLPAIGGFLSNPDARANFVRQVDRFLGANPSYRGLSLDFEDVPTEAQQGYMALISALYSDFHARNLRLYVNAPVGDDDWDLAFIAQHSDGILLMNYDQHQTESGPGPIAAQDWFVDNLKEVLKTVPKEKLICSLGSYGYDWTMALPPADPKHKGAPAKAPLQGEAGARWWRCPRRRHGRRPAMPRRRLQLDPDSLNVHFAYDDNDAHVRHQVWFLDAVTILNQMRAARALGIQTYALWRLGSEDDSIWKMWDTPMSSDPTKTLADVGPGFDVDAEGEGDIMRVTRKPQNGHRAITMDDDDSVPTQFRDDYSGDDGSVSALVHGRITLAITRARWR